jgi:VWFA-related protein
VNRDVRRYTPFIARVGSAFEALLVGETGEAAVIEYGDDVQVLKPFGRGDVQLAMRRIAGAGRRARAIDAGLLAVSMLGTRPARRARVLVFVGQAMDSGSESRLAALREAAERANVAVYALVLPEAGRDFVSDTFSIEGLSSTKDRGGFQAGVDLGRLVPVLSRSGAEAQGKDPFAVLTAATGGTEFHFRQQRELEDGISLIGVELRSAYVLSYSPKPPGPGYHKIRVQVGIRGAKVYSRPGYWLRR